VIIENDECKHSPTYQIVKQATEAIRTMPWIEFVITVESEHRQQLLNDLHDAVEAVLSEIKVYTERKQSSSVGDLK